MDNVMPHERRRQVFRLLAEHGPLSRRGLHACLYPPIESRRLREVLQRLTSQELLAKRHYKSLGKDAHYYQITQEPKLMERVSEIMNVRLGEIKQPQFRRIELFHSETCAVWKEILKQLFPTAIVLRDHEYVGRSDVNQFLMAESDDWELRPDIILILKSKNTSDTVGVAIEIERSHKSRKRLIRKLLKYTTQSRFDGMIYVCDDTAISKRLRDIYNADILSEALRIQHYGKNFFLLTDGTQDIQNDAPMMFNSKNEAVSLTDWIHKLVHTEAVMRRDAKFQVPPHGAGVLTGR